MASPNDPLRGHSDSEGGFATSRDLAGTLRVRVWGFWGDGVVASLVRGVVDACRSSALPRQVIVDAKDLKPQRDDGQAALLAMFNALSAMGIEHVSVVVTSPLTRLMLGRIAKSTSKKGLVELKVETGAADEEL